MPNGDLVNFPDDMPKEQIRSMIASKFGEPSTWAKPADAQMPVPQMQGGEAPPAQNPLGSDRQTERLSPDYATQQQTDYQFQQDQASYRARMHGGAQAPQQPQQPYVAPEFSPEQVVEMNTAAGRQEAYNQLPWYQKAPRAADDVVRGIANGLTSGFADKAAAAANSTIGQRSYAENLAIEREKTLASRARGGSAIAGAEIAGNVMTGTALVKNGITATGRLGTAAMPGIKGVLARAGLMSVDGAGYGAVDALGNDTDVKTGAITGAIGGAGGSVMADGLGAAVRKVSSSFKGKPKVPDLSVLKNKAKEAYSAAENAGVIIKPEGVKRLNSGIQEDLAHFGYDPALQPRMAVVLNRLEKAQDGNITLKGMDVIRRIADSARASMDPSEKKIGVHVINKIDDFVENLNHTDVLSGDVMRGSAALKSARTLWSRVAKNERLVAAIERAENRAASTGSGANAENTIRQNFLKELEKGRGYTPDEKAALKQIVTGSMGQNTLRKIGKFAPTGVVSGGIGTTTGAAIGSVFGGPAGAAVGAVALPAVGAGAKFLADKGVRQGVEALQILVRSGGDKAALEAARGSIAKLSQSQRDTITRLVTSGAIVLNRGDQEPR